MKDFMAFLLERSLHSSPNEDGPVRPAGRKLPVMIPATGRQIPVMTNTEIFEVLDSQDDQHHGRLS